MFFCYCFFASTEKQVSAHKHTHTLTYTAMCTHVDIHVSFPPPLSITPSPLPPTHVQRQKEKYCLLFTTLSILSAFNIVVAWIIMWKSFLIHSHSHANRDNGTSSLSELAMPLAQLHIFETICADSRSFGVLRDAYHWHPGQRFFGMFYHACCGKTSVEILCDRMRSSCQVHGAPGKCITPWNWSGKVSNEGLPKTCFLLQGTLGPVGIHMQAHVFIRVRVCTHTHTHTHTHTYTHTYWK